MTVAPRTPEWAGVLPAHLAELKTRRRAGDLAALHRALSSFPRLDTRALAVVAPFARPWSDAQDAAILTGGLWAAFHTAYHDPVPGRGNLGQALRVLDPRERDRLVSAATSPCAPATLRRHLAVCVRALSTRGAAPEWARLHADIYQILSGRPEEARRSWLHGALSPRADDETEEER